jgi:hypothetical protein
MRMPAVFFGPYAPEALTTQVAVFSHDFKRFKRLTKLATSSKECAGLQKEQRAKKEQEGYTSGHCTIARTRYPCFQKGAGMKCHGCFGFFVLAIVLGVVTHAMAKPARDLHADHMTDKLWWIIDITKQFQPEFQAHVTLEAPDGERLALTLQGEHARTLVHDDVITLERKPGIQVDPLSRR